MMVKAKELRTSLLIKELNGIGNKRKETPVKDRQGNLLTKDADLKNQWKEHFETVLNRPIPSDEEIPPAETDLNIFKWVK